MASCIVGDDTQAHYRQQARAQHHQGRQRPTNDEDVDQEPLAKRQKTASAFEKAAKDPTNDEDVDQEPLAKRQKTSGTDASTLRAAGEAA